MMNSPNCKSSPEIYAPDILDRISCYEGDRPLFDLYNVEEEIQLALSRDGSI